VPRIVIISSILALVCLTIIFWMIHPSPFLVFSIGLSAAACGLAIFVFLRSHSILVLPLAVMFFLMAMRQALILLIRADVMYDTPAAEAISDFPGLIVTGLAIYTVIYFKRTIHGRERFLQMEKELVRAENEYRSLVEKITAVIYKAKLDKNATLLFVSPQIEQVIGYTGDECLADPLIWRKRIHPNDLDQVCSEMDDCHRTGRPFVMEYRVLHKDGREVWVHDEAAIELDSQGMPLHFHGVVNDITAFKKIEVELEQRNMALQSTQDRLQRSEELFRTLFESSRDAVLILERDLILDGNGAARRMFDCRTTEDLAARRLHEITPVEQPDGQSSSDWIKKEVEKALAGGSAFFEWTMTGINGRPFPAEVLLSSFDHQGSRVLQAVVRDISRRKNRIEQGRQADRLDAATRFAEGLAHDFKILLTGMQAGAGLLLSRTEPGSPEHEAVLSIDRAVERASGLNRRLLGFAGKGQRQSVAVDLHEIIQQVTTLLDRSISNAIGITQELGAKKATVMGDPDLIKHVLMNIAHNACDAMPDGGELTFSTATVDLDGRQCRRDGDLAPGPYLALSVSDTGSGIPEAIRDRIFEPFFTTKRPESESGMGLAFVHGVVTSHGGFVQVDSNDGKGSIFVLHFPLALDEEIEARERDRDGRERSCGSILLVDDEEVVLDVVTTILVNNGFEVESRTSGKEALSFYEKEGWRFDLVLIDMMMPELDGSKFFHRLREIDPDVKAVFMTGFGPNEQMTAVLKNEGALGYLQKPFNTRELIGAIRNAISGRRWEGIGQTDDEEWEPTGDRKRAEVEEMSRTGTGQHHPER